VTENPRRYASARQTLHRTAIGLFRRLPVRVRRQLVRAGTPNYTLGAVVLIRDHDERLLLVHQPPQPGWSLPGGLMNRRESPVAAAVREVREEIGLRLSPEQLTPTAPNAQVNPWIQQVDLVFTATVDAATAQITVDEVEIGAARWFPVDELPELTGPTMRLLGRCGLGPAAGRTPPITLPPVENAE
jgi:ADP-ribose pyrophosphatase YjhB (NUDIX family)